MIFKQIYVIIALCISGSLPYSFGTEAEKSAPPTPLRTPLQEDKVTPFEESLKSRGVKYVCVYPNNYFIFDEKTYDSKNEKYARLNALEPMEEKVYTREIDFRLTHTPFMQAVAIIGYGGLYTHAITHGIYDCVGIVVQQEEEGKIKKSLLTHVCSGSNLSSFSSIVDRFLDGIDQVGIKVHFFTTHNTEHFLAAYSYFSDKKISDDNMTLTGNKTRVRVIHSREGSVTARYFPQDLYEEYRKKKEDFHDQYLTPKIVLIDEKGDIYQEVTTFPEEDVYYTCDEEEIYRALGSAGPHIRLGLNVYKNGNHDYLLIPSNPRDCEALLESRQSAYKTPQRSLL